LRDRVDIMETVSTGVRMMGGKRKPAKHLGDQQTALHLPNVL
jgi:hypothetical protein